MENRIEIVRGTTNNFVVNITDESTGASYVPKPGEVAVFGLKKEKSDSILILTKEAQISDDGVARFTLCPEDTSALCCDKYYYDVGLESGDNFYNIIPPTPFYIANNITAKGCSK